MYLLIGVGGHTKFGIVMGYNLTNFIELKKVNGEKALIISVYNIRRCITILGIPELINRIKNWTPDYKRILFSFFNTTSLKTFRTMQNLDRKLAALNRVFCNQI